MELTRNQFQRRINMLYTNITGKLLGLQDVIVKNVEETVDSKYIHIELPRKVHSCPCCGTSTDKIHDYRNQKIKDIPMQGKNTYLVLRKRRYVCPDCNKRFYEEIKFVPKKHQITQRLMLQVFDKLKNVHSFTSVAKDLNISTSTVIRIFDIITFSSPKELPQTLAIDEFKGNTNGEKYQCILTDPENKVVIDILPERYTSYLIQYFKKYDRKDREKVKYFVSDMWKPFTDTATTFFPQATQVVDKYHYVRQIIWAFEDVRKREQKKYGDKYRKLFKRSRGILIKRYEELNDYDKERLESIFYVSRNLRIAYQLKEAFYEIVDCEDRQEARNKMQQWILDAQNSNISEYTKCTNTLINWQKGILNSYDVPYTNGFTEGCNNKIKVLKRNAYGYSNFIRFRKRILLMFSEQKQRKNVAV